MAAKAKPEKKIRAVLKDDHQKIRMLANKLCKACSKKSVDDELCFGTFQNLKAIVTAHTKAEEQAFYSLFTTLEKISSGENLRQLSFEGFEEHSLVDQVLKEMQDLHEVNDEFKAKATVVCDLLEHHIAEEERSFLPAAEKVLSRQIQIDTATEFSKVRTEIIESEQAKHTVPKQKRRSLKEGWLTNR